MPAKKISISFLSVVVIAAIAVLFFARDSQPRTTFRPIPRRKIQSVKIEANVLEQPLVESKPSPPLEAQQCWAKIEREIKIKGELEFNKRIDAQVSGVIDPWVLHKDLENPDVPTQTPANLFFLGLAQTGLLDGRNVDHDEEQGLGWLLKSAAMEPDNSAPLLYAAVIHYRRGHEAEAEELIKKANATTRRFDSHISAISKEILSHVRTPEDYYAAISIVSELSVPDYSQLRGMLQDAGGAPTIAKQLLQDGLDPRKSRDPQDYLSLEYATGLSLLKNEPSVSTFPTLKELWENKHADLEVFGYAAMKAVEKDCDLQAIEPFLNELTR